MISSLIITLAAVTGQLIRIPVSSGGITLLDTAVFILCFLGLIKLKFKLKKPPPFITAAFIFILIAIVSLILTPLHLRLSEYVTSLLYTIRFSLYILFAQLIYSGSFNNFKDQITSTLVYSGVGLAILGLLQFIFLPDLSFLSKQGWDPHYFRTVSTFLDPNFAGAFFVLTLILLLYHLGGRSKATPRVFVLFFVITFFALMTTFSRSSYLMFLISGLTLAFLEKSKKLFLKTVLLFLILLLGFRIYTLLVSQPRHISREQSASFRFSTWQQGINIFQKYPFLGIGFNSYRYGLKELNLADNQFLDTHGASSNDSSLLFVAATTGSLGLISYLFFLGSLIWKNKKNLEVAASLGLIIHSLFANSLFFPPILLWIILIALIKNPLLSSQKK